MTARSQKRGLERRSNYPYTNIGNRAINDVELSADGLAVLVYLLSKPPGWVVIPAEVAKRFRYGRNRIYSVLKELIERGYIVRTRQQAEDGKWSGYSYQVWDDPKAAQTENKGSDRVPDGGDTVHSPYTSSRYTAVGDALISTENKQISPLTPQRGSADCTDLEEQERVRDAAQEHWQQFRENYPWEPQHSRQSAERSFFKLSASDQRVAASYAGQYREDCKGRNRFVKEPSKWLRGKCWQGYLEQEMRVEAVHQAPP
jgi:predicted transcriptional regulator